MPIPANSRSRTHALDPKLMVLDLLCILIGFCGAYLLRDRLLEPWLLPHGWMSKVIFEEDLLILGLYPLLILAGLAFASFYDFHRITRLRQAIRSISLGIIYATLTFIVIVYLFSHQSLVSRWQILFMILFSGALLLFRWMTFRKRARRLAAENPPKAGDQSVVAPFPPAIPLDIILMVLAFWIAHWIRRDLLEPILVPRGLMLRSWLAHYLPLLPLYPAAMLFALSFNSFYDFEITRRFRRAVGVLILSTVEATAILMALIYLFSHQELITRWQILLMAGWMNLFLALRWLLLHSFLERVMRHARNQESPATGEAPFPVAKIGGLGFHRCTMREAVQWLTQCIRERRRVTVISPNIDGLFRYDRFPDLRPYYERADLILADGVPVFWLSQFTGQPVPEKVSGSDLFLEMTAVAARENFRIYLLGAEPGVGEKAKRRIEKDYPGAIVCGIDAPPPGFEMDPDLRNAVLERIRMAQPDMLCVALGSDRQKRFLADTIDSFDCPVRMEVGASIDFVAGMQRRAPRILQQMGLEWFWRLCMNPRRLFRRYLLNDLPFFLRLIGRSARKSNIPS